jgi:2-dehydro-3-deoxyphosphogluconate aldolase / (4S)-4-hydroxy-2-oxoglutarate aldolase
LAPGTVRYLSELETAISAGAQFIVTPTISEEIIKRCVNLQIPIIPGALSPTEIQRAYDLGASFVKVFPVGAMGGASYIRDLRGPFKDIPLMACGGVSEKNAPEYRESGADLLAFGGSIFNPTQMRLGQWDLIEEKLTAFMTRAGH